MLVCHSACMSPETKQIVIKCSPGVSIATTGSQFSIMTSLQAEQLENQVGVLAGWRFFFLSLNSDQPLGILSPEVKQLGCDTNYVLNLLPEISRDWSYTSTKRNVCLQWIVVCQSFIFCCRSCVVNFILSSSVLMELCLCETKRNVYRFMMHIMECC